MKILLFSADWCGPCQVLKSLMSQTVGIETIDIEKIDPGTPSNREIAQKYNILAIPTMVVVKDNGEWTEYRSVSRIYDKIKTLLRVNA